MVPAQFSSPIPEGVALPSHEKSPRKIFILWKHNFDYQSSSNLSTNKKHLQKIASPWYLIPFSYKILSTQFTNQTTILKFRTQMRQEQLEKTLFSDWTFSNSLNLIPMNYIFLFVHQEQPGPQCPDSHQYNINATESISNNLHLHLNIICDRVYKCPCSLFAFKLEQRFEDWKNGFFCQLWSVSVIHLATDYDGLWFGWVVIRMDCGLDGVVAWICSDFIPLFCPLLLWLWSIVIWMDCD